MGALLGLFRFLQGSAGALTLSLILLLASTGLGLVQPRLIEYAIDSGIKTGRVSAIIWSAAGIIMTGCAANNTRKPVDGKPVGIGLHGPVQCFCRVVRIRSVQEKFIIYSGLPESYEASKNTLL